MPAKCEAKRPKIRIRAARPVDTPTILGFIQELAEYEKLRDECVATTASLKRSLFGPRPAAEVFLCSVDGEDAAFAVAFPNFSTFLGKPGLYLEDLFVKPEFRGHGIGRRMLTHLAKTAMQRGYGRFEWAVLDWNASAIRFYENLGAQMQEDWRLFRITGPALTKLARS